MLIDSHCHLDLLPAEERDDFLTRARHAGVGEMVTIGTTMEQSRNARAIAQANDHVWCTVGVHPQQAGDAPVPTPQALVELTQHPKVIGIGETGLDYYYDTSPRDVQEASFRAHIQAARLADVPVAIHTRDADQDMIRILRDEQGKGAFNFLLHCFSSSRQLAESAIEIGGYLSLSGILTFPKSTELRDIARDAPADRLLVETDAPYLAPVPLRGKRNEPAYVVHTAHVLAQTRGVTPDELAALTTGNFRRLFKRAA